MADMTAPSGQAPTMAPPVRTDEEIMPRNRAFTASSTILSRYIQLHTANIREASYYQEYQANVSKHRRFLAGFGNPNAGSVTSFGTVIFFTYTFSASSLDKTWNLILRLKTRRIFRNLESFVGGRLREGDYRLLKRIPTVAAAGQKDVNSQLHAHTLNSLSMTAKRPTTQLPYNVLMNELVNDGIKLLKLEINTGFINGLLKKWLSFCQSLKNTNNVKDSKLASLFGKLKYEENLIDIIYETKKNKYLVSATPLSTAFFSFTIVQDFQDSPVDEEDTRNSHKGSAVQKKLTKPNVTNVKGHFARDCWSKNLVSTYQSPSQPKPLSSPQHKPELRPTKDFEAKYNKVKAKLALLSLSASASKASMIKNKDSIYETEKNKSLIFATPLSTDFFSSSIVQVFQDNHDDEEDTRSSHEYLNDIEEEYQERDLLANSKRFFKKAKYNKVKAKLALLSLSASASKASMIKNKGLIAEAYEWEEEEFKSLSVARKQTCMLECQKAAICSYVLS
nr:hypothetical protein [Tanacetum cinerariifolium]